MLSLVPHRRNIAAAWADHQSPLDLRAAQHESYFTDQQSIFMLDYVAVVPLFVRFITNYSQYKVLLKRLRYVPFVQKPAHCKHSLTFF